MSRTKPIQDRYIKTDNTRETPAAPEVTEQKVDLLIQDLWQQGTDSVHDMCVVNTDALSYVQKTPEKCLHKSERGRIRCTWRLASGNVDTSPPLLPRWTG